MTLYLAYVSGGVTRDHLAPKWDDVAEKPLKQPNMRKEFWVQRELEALGVTVYCPRKVEAKRSGKQRRWEVIVDPFIPNYIFVDMPPEAFVDVIKVKHLSPTLQVIPASETPSVLNFVDDVERDFDNRQRRIKAGEQVEQYRDGQLLDVFDGPFKDSVVRYVGIVERSSDWPVIRGEMEMMGRTVPVEVDILQVKAAE